MSPLNRWCRLRVCVSLGSSAVPDCTGGPNGCSLVGDDRGELLDAMSMRGESGPEGQISDVRR